MNQVAKDQVAKLLMSSTYGKVAGPRGKLLMATLFHGRHFFHKSWGPKCYRCARCGTYRQTRRGKPEILQPVSLGKDRFGLSEEPRIHHPAWRDERDVPHECRQEIYRYE